MTRDFPSRVGRTPQARRAARDSWRICPPGPPPPAPLFRAPSCGGRASPVGRSYEVVVQGDGAFRRTTLDISRLKARNAAGEMVPIGTVAQLKDNTIPYRVPRYNLFPAAEVQGVAAPGCRHRHGAASDGGTGSPGPAEGHRVRMDRSRLPATAARHPHPARVRRGRPLLFSSFCSPLRELEAAAGHRPDRADVPAGFRYRPARTRGCRSTSWRRLASSCWSAWPPRTPS